MIAHATAKDIKQVNPPEPFFAQYDVTHYNPPEKPASDEEYDRQIKKLTREGMAKGIPEHAARRAAENIANILKEPSGGKHEEVACFGAGAGSKLWGGYNKTDVAAIKNWPAGYMPRYVLKSDRHFFLKSFMEKNGKAYQQLTVRPINAEYPPEKILILKEAVIFGFEPVGSLSEGKPSVTKSPNGDTILIFTSMEDPHTKSGLKVIIDKEERIASISKFRHGPTIDSTDVWAASNFVKANDGWVPGVVTRKCVRYGKLWNALDYRLTKLETGQKVIDKWFSDKVDQPTFVYDSRYHGATVKYFTKNRLLPDDEIEKRARALAASQTPLHLPKNPLKTVGIILILLGAIMLVWRIGWPKKASGLGNKKEESKQE